MSPMIADNTLDELRSRCDIVELISSYFPLKRSGRNFKACCPFHEEKTPSFMVNQEKQIFKCFGCGKGGNVFHFIMQKENVEFLDSVRMVAERVGYELPEFKQPSDDDEFKKKDLFDVMSFAVKCYVDFLNDEKTGATAKNYILARGVKPETIMELKLGFAPSGRMFYKAAIKKGYSDDILLAAGLLVDDAEHGPRDKFYNRILFPVFNPEGRAIGFSGRVLDDREPKYLNSPETRLFNKGRVLYGLNFTRDEIMKQKHAVICEGHLDFVMLYQSGIRNVIAAQGTAFTEQQARLLKRHAPRVTFAFDSDSAGNKAVIRSLEPLLHAGLEVRVAEIPEGHDPDSYVRESGVDEFIRILSNAKGYFDFQYDFLTSEHNIREQQGKLDIASEMLSSIKKVANEIVKDELVQKLSQKMNITSQVLRRELGKIRSQYRPFSEEQKTQVRKITAEEELIDYALCFNDSLEEIMEALQPEDLQFPHCRDILGKMFTLMTENGTVTFEDLLKSVKDEEEASLLTELMVRNAFTEQNDEVLRELLDCVLTPGRIARKEELKGLMDEAVRENGSIDPELQKEYLELHRSLMRKGRVRFKTR